MKEFRKRAVVCMENRKRKKEGKGQKGGYRSDGDTYAERGERENKGSRGSGRKWPVQGGWNHLGFRYIEC